MHLPEILVDLLSSTNFASYGAEPYILPAFMVWTEKISHFKIVKIKDSGTHGWIAIVSMKPPTCLQWNLSLMCLFPFSNIILSKDLCILHASPNHLSIVHEVINDIVCICYYNVDRPSYKLVCIQAPLPSVTYSHNSGLADWTISTLGIPRFFWRYFRIYIIDVRQRFSYLMWTQWLLVHHPH